MYFQQVKEKGGMALGTHNIISPWLNASSVASVHIQQAREEEGADDGRTLSCDSSRALSGGVRR